MNISQIFAIAKKETKLNLRFKYNFFANALITPMKFLIFFTVVYSGFYMSGAESIGEVTRQNYISFLLLGSLVYSFFSSGYNAFCTKFIQEKYWRTIDALLISPLNRIKLIIGVGFSELFRQVVIAPIFFIVGFLILPISFLNLLVILSIILMIFLGVIGFGLIYGVFALSNENLLFLFNYFFWIWAFLSCFYYPISALPRFLHSLVLFNPVYHGLYIIRELWINGSVNNFLFHFMIVLAFALIVPLVAVFLFNKIIKKIGVTGY